MLTGLSLGLSVFSPNCGLQGAEELPFALKTTQKHMIQYFTDSGAAHEIPSQVFTRSRLQVQPLAAMIT